MKVAFTNSSNRLVAGAERYIESAASFLRSAGHETALWHENETPSDRKSFSSAVFPLQRCLNTLGRPAWLRTLEQWQPDLVFGHGLYDPQPEAETLKVAPSVFFAHNYHGTCISGQKCHSSPSIQPCSRQFGTSCLVLFYPRRCGGLNPLTLLGDYRRSQDRLKVIGKYTKVITHTRHMEEEYRKHGIACQAIAPYSISNPLAVTPLSGTPTDAAWSLLYIGRMMELKGGGVLLDALPMVARILPEPIRVRFVGDGPLREKWQNRAREIERTCPNLTIEFTGWLSGERLDEVTSQAHLHVLPSLWPEPFGLSGLQLGLRSIPTVAFRVGGIPDWLHDQVNGVLAECAAPLAENLCRAITASLSDRNVYRDLCSGALRVASSMTAERHCESMLGLLEQMSARRAAGVCPV